MIGNDIVDLELANKQSNWKRKGWLKKIFTQSEQKNILNSPKPSSIVWQYWSRKEAVYKAHQRRFSLAPRYNPKDFECLEDQSVVIDGYKYHTDTQSSEKYIYSIASSKQHGFSSDVCFGNSARSKLKEFIANSLCVELPLISIEKDIHQIPIIKINNKAEKINFSLSNHGHFSAFIIDL
ncbi:4'-phosphopantetheinyl transferase superfamily protein [Aquimarina sp. 2201CG5-10]|uniref:4'-phosphopantetheinyl transferase family protein n=1 Tax=Aquimarina callyspongiae TaxID=3098150 RepID=UPI002AB4249F|nr:4'-phosphopantetheinyl transferase superfamily protein [Aquimarina sp. 2201CG5-10]MDY8136099.1 4'-phosphopantetheinyl transferase superfamily protein [Aquimarina sp. 2201CG5-10]